MLCRRIGKARNDCLMGSEIPRPRVMNLGGLNGVQMNLTGQPINASCCGFPFSWSEILNSVQLKEAERGISFGGRYSDALLVSMRRLGKRLMVICLLTRVSSSDTFREHRLTRIILKLMPREAKLKKRGFKTKQ